jgi:hypothetical protein
MDSELVQLTLNIGASDGDSTPSEVKRGTPTYRSGSLKKSDQVKCSCVNLYENDFTKYLLGDVFHPGGLELTGRMAGEIGLNAHDTVLDVACGQGTTAVYLARNFGCRVLGVDLSEANLSLAGERAKTRGAGDRTTFLKGDAERLPMEDRTCSAVISECAFCTFPDKAVAASEMFRVLKQGGRLGLTDVAADRARLPEEMQTLLFRAACIADARTAEDYQQILAAAGFGDLTTADCSETLLELTGSIRKRLLLAELAAKLKKLGGGIDFGKAKRWLGMAEELIRDGVIGYVLITGRKA